jgi:hypothetical protein
MELLTGKYILSACILLLVIHEPGIIDQQGREPTFTSEEIYFQLQQ